MYEYTTSYFGHILLKFMKDIHYWLFNFRFDLIIFKEFAIVDLKSNSTLDQQLQILQRWKQNFSRQLLVVHTIHPFINEFW